MFNHKSKTKQSIMIGISYLIIATIIALVDILILKGTL